jgi:hypothetical protein
MSTPPRSQRPDWRDTPEAEETARRVAALVKRTLDHVVAERFVTARFSLTPRTAVRVLDGAPVSHIRRTVSAVARVESYLLQDGACVVEATGELEALLQFWTDGWRE